MRTFKAVHVHVCKVTFVEYDLKQLFDRFCVEQLKDRNDKMSKTISREKGQRIVNVIKIDPSAVTYSHNSNSG